MADTLPRTTGGLPTVRVRLPDGKIREMNEVSYRSKLSLVRYIIAEGLKFGPVRLHVVVDGEEKELDDDDYICNFYGDDKDPLIVATTR
jgi:hypothetical protein